ncbi:MAG: hypothetical protein AB7G44_01515 [Bacteroidia bacterium]
MELPWKYVENQFMIATNKSYKKALKLSNYHDSALATAPAAISGILYMRYHPLHMDFVLKYNQWVSAGGSQEGQTLNVKQQLKLARLKIADWDVAIQVVYPKTTPRYKAIFPNGRKPFNKGGVDANINAFDILSMNIGADPALTTVKAEVDATYLLLDTARDNQEGAKASVTQGSGNVETARIAIMSMQYRDAMWLLDNYYDTREAVTATYIDLQTLRDKQQTIFNATLAIGETKAVLTRTFVADDELRLKVDGEGPVVFYLASTPGGTDSSPVYRNTNQDEKVVINQFGISNYGTHRYLTAVNNSGVETHILVEVV